MKIANFPRRGAGLVVCALLVAVLNSAGAAQASVAGTSTLSGYAYVDRNNDGVLAFSNELHPEMVISGVTIQLLLSGGINPLATAQTDAMGHYEFSSLAAGHYDLRQIQPVEYIPGLSSVGQIRNTVTLALNPAGSSVGAAGVDSSGRFFSNIVLTANSRGDLYNFAELGMAPGHISKRSLIGAAAPPVFSPPPATMTAVPEPGCLGLAAAALVGLWSRARRGR